MIELAPQRKQGLTLTSPLIAASGAVGFANAASDLIALERFGAIVTAPLSYRGRRGHAQPRLIAVNGGLLLNHGAQNPGWHRARDQYSAAWARLRVPIIVQLAGHPSEWGELAKRIEGVRAVAAIAIDVADAELLEVIAGLRRMVELPLLARLPYGGAPLAPMVVAAGADALVCIAPPRGAQMDFESGQMVEGELFGPLVKPLAVQTLRAVLAHTITVPLIACGGVYSKHDVAELLAAGASAVMVDSLAWLDPRALNVLLASG